MPPVASILGRAAAWPASYVHRLPDDAFLHIEKDGARLDASGRTTPRSLRHLPIRDADGSLDLPHLRDALAQLPHAGPWLPPQLRDTLIAKAKGLHAEALRTTHKAAKGLPDWSLGYLSHLDRHEALGVSRDDAHAAWGGDKHLAGRAVDLLKGLRRTPAGTSKSAGDDPALVSKLRKKLTAFRARAGERPGTAVTLKSLVAAHDRGTAAYDAAARPVVKSREQWGNGRVNALLRLTASGKPDHPAYAADNDLLPAGHPRASKAAPAAKPGAVTRPRPPAPAPQPVATPAKPKAKAKAPAGKPPKGMAALPKPAEKAVDVSAVGEEVPRTGGTPWPDIDMAWLASQVGDFDSTGVLPKHDALISATNPLGDVGPIEWRLPSAVTKDELGGGDLAAGGKLAPEQGVIGGDPPGFEHRTFQGIPVVVDRPKGTVQTGIGKDGEEWSRTYETDYGYVPATLGGDDEELDVFLGPDETAPNAYVAIQNDDDGDFDEFKAFLGYPDEDAARAAYLAHIPERFLDRFFTVPVAFLQANLDIEPVAMMKAQSQPRRSFAIGPGNKVHVRWPTKVYSDPPAPTDPPPAGDPASSASTTSTSSSTASSSSSSTSTVAAAAPAPAFAPESGAAPGSPASFNAKARRAKALASVAKAGAHYEGAKPLPPELANHPALTAAPTDTYPNPDEVGGWVYVIDGGDTPDADPNWIAFVDTTGKALLWTKRDEDGGVDGAPYAFQRDDLIKPDAQGRLPLIGWTTAPGGPPTSKAEAPDDHETAIRDDGVQIQLDADALEQAAKAARAVQGMLPKGKVHAISKLPEGDEAEKGMDGGTLLFSPDSTFGDDPAALGAFLRSLKVPWLAEVPDAPRTRVELAKAGGAVFLHKDVPGSVFAASYPLPQDTGVDVLNPHPDAGDDEATAFKSKPRVPGPDADVPVNAKPPGLPQSPDADRGVAPALVDGAGAVGKAVLAKAKAGQPMLAGTRQAIAMGYLALDPDGNVVLGPKSLTAEELPPDPEPTAKAQTKYVLTIETSPAGYEGLKALLANLEKHGGGGHGFGIIADESTTGYDVIPKKGEKIKLGYWDGDGGAYAEIKNVEKIEPPPRDPDANVLGKRKDGWYAYSDEDGSEIGGPYESKGGAIDRLRKVTNPKPMTTAAIERFDRGEQTAKAFDFVAVGKDAEGRPREERYVLGPVLIPDVVDLQGDKVSAEEIEKSERNWMERYQNLGLQHEADPAKIDAFRESMGGLLDPSKAVLVESYIVRSDAGFVMINGRKVLSGTWMMGVIYKSDELWNEIKTGKRTGFSIGGFARRVPLDGAA